MLYSSLKKNYPLTSNLLRLNMKEFLLNLSECFQGGKTRLPFVIKHKAKIQKLQNLAVKMLPFDACSFFILLFMAKKLPFLMIIWSCLLALTLMTGSITASMISKINAYENLNKNNTKKWLMENLDNEELYKIELLLINNSTITSYQQLEEILITLENKKASPLTVDYMIEFFTHNTEPVSKFLIEQHHLIDVSIEALEEKIKEKAKLYLENEEIKNPINKFLKEIKKQETKLTLKL